MKKIFTLAILSAVLCMGTSNVNAQNRCGGSVSRAGYLVGVKYDANTGKLELGFGLQNNSGSSGNVQICAYTAPFRFDTSFMTLDRSNGNSYFLGFGGCITNTGSPVVKSGYTYLASFYGPYNGTSSWNDVIDQRSSSLCTDLVPVTNGGGSRIFMKYVFNVSPRGQQMITNGTINVLNPCATNFILDFATSTSFAVPATDTVYRRLLIYALGNVTYRNIKPEALDASGSNCTGNVGSVNNIPTGNIAYDAGGVIVPVKYSSFDVIKRSKNAFISWTTESESNNQGFTIERKIGNSDFEPVALIASKGSNGNSATTLHYDFTDVNVNAKGMVYYRIRQTETGGKVEYTAVRSIRFDGQFSISIYPNPVPANKPVNVVLPEVTGGVDIYLTDNSGRVINAWNNVTDRIKSISVKVAGYYFVRVISKSTGEQYTEKIVVNQ